MAKYLIRWNVGHGDCYDECESESQEDASGEACFRWMCASEVPEDHSAAPMTKELAEEHGFDWEDDQ